MSAYLSGTQVLGAEALGSTGSESVVGEIVGDAPDQYLVVHVKNVPDLVRAQGGAAGALVYKLAPGTIVNKVYDTMRTQFLDKFKENGVVADVTVTTTPPVGKPSRGDLLTGVGLGVFGVGTIWAVWHFGLSRLFGGAQHH